MSKTVTMNRAHIYWELVPGSMLAARVTSIELLIFPIVMYGCENWTIKEAECRRIDAFELWCWRRLLKSPVDCKEIKPVNLKEINPEYSLDGIMLKHQYFDHLM